MPAAPVPAVSVADLGASYGAAPVLAGVDFELATGELLAVLGPSGCGKTTLLRCLAGFERIEAGRISLAGDVVALPRVHVPAHRRQVAVVPQEGALFPHLSVAENVGFGLRHRRPGRVARIRECLALVGLAGLGERMPHQLSGGQQQRVALARAMAPRPPLILLDEPFGALDAALRTDLRQAVRRALKEDGATAVLVTHDQAEALSVADRVAVMEGGRLRQVGTPEEVYARPADAWVARFVGEADLLPVLTTTPDGRVRTAAGAVAGIGAGTRAVVRPEHVRLTDGGEGVAARVVDVEFRGHELLAALELPDGTAVRARSLRAPVPGSVVTVSLTGPVALVD
ncbi:ABC transporter ATP-binding protein [Micrococcus sp.]|uniref:ABC transporter ATP-binding protein n=1 Tax=Micrococcus sp. TaxID=1271 RepID=UPI0026DBF47B|nr:ABC transporter ATP-binding protein [Micrococcus sp.]MDO4240557.1 ABC transporter ATP-binding protein [Micrococcus sp.]